MLERLGQLAQPEEGPEARVRGVEELVEERRPEAEEVPAAELPVFDDFCSVGLLVSSSVFG